MTFTKKAAPNLMGQRAGPKDKADSKFVLTFPPSHFHRISRHPNSNPAPTPPRWPS